jgi:two-component system sensor histidine kinase QseC
VKPVSLRWRLRWLVIGALAAVLVPLGLYSFAVTRHELGELTDGRLAQSAHTLQLMLGAQGDAFRPADAIATATVQPGKHTFESEVAFQVVDRDGRVRMATENFAALGAPEADDRGFRDIRLGRYQWRTYTLVDTAHGAVIRVGERYDSRHDIVSALLLDHALPVLVGLPLIALLIGLAVKRGLKPLARLARVLQARTPGNRAPVVLDPLPDELRPVIEALNAQLSRMEDALERERRFSADVAHELRTPLTTSLIGLEGAMAAAGPAAAGLGLEQTHQALNVLARRVEQLLVLARLESGAVDDARGTVDLVEVVQKVIEELAQTIADSQVDIALHVPEQHVKVKGFAAGLQAMIRNLVENALRHVADDGHVLLSVARTERHAIIEVTDDGPGIPVERRTEVFARFHREKSSRGDGYGLGLSIVQRVAELHGARIELLDAEWGRGLCVRITLEAIG